MASDQRDLFPDLRTSRFGDGRRLQPLFIPKILRQVADDFRLRGDGQDRAHQILLKWADLDSSGKLARMTESTLQGEFIGDVFGDALGYTRFSEHLDHWQIQEHFAVANGQADAAIGYFAAEGSDPPRALVEMKGPKVNVDRDRFNGRTPVQQLWEYLNHVPECPWGIVCNYVSLRLYHHHKTPRAYEQFTLQELREETRFREFYCLFSRGGLLPMLRNQRPRADDILERSDDRQREVGEKLYEKYRDQRLALIKHLRRAPHEKTLDQAIHVAQRLLDRIVFVAFCEDRRLLPPKSIDKAWRDVSAFTLATNPKWQNFRALFRSIDQGNERHGISAYNGGLFAQDPEVDDIDLHDEWTNFFKDLGEYDFQDEVNVEVLGHIFEQSITDLETLRLDPETALAKRPAKVSGKRKREGIYYTPRHITRYVVEHTIGRVLHDRFAALAAEMGVDPLIEPVGKRKAAWLTFQKARLNVLHSLRVCDPACGSGAFLVAAFEYMEHIYDQVYAALEPEPGDPMDLMHQIKSTILRENLFGVDLSQEAVNITRLALWIATAERGKTLTDLSQNIQCGNSVVDDATIDPLALDWRSVFPQVFSQGGFDCIIGNPPYVKLQNFRRRLPEAAAFLIRRYRAAQTGNFDLYLPFIERGLELLRPGGRLGFIAPSVWLFNEYGAGLRALVRQRQSLDAFVDFKSHQVFSDATTYTALQFFSTEPAAGIGVADASSGELRNLTFYPVAYRNLGEGAWALLPKSDQAILDKMRTGGITLADATEQIFQGLITSADDIYHLVKLAAGRYFSDAVHGEVEIEDEIMHPLVSGVDAIPFATPATDKYLVFPYRVTKDECRLLTPKEMSRYKRCWQYLRDQERRLRAREGGKFDDDQWYRFGRPQNIDKQQLPKIGVPQTIDHLTAFYDTHGRRYFNNVRINGILARRDKRYDLWYILALLNSRALDFFFRRTAKPKDRDYFEANKQFIAPLPIPKGRHQTAVVKLAQKLAILHGELQTLTSRVHRRFQVDLPPAELVPGSPVLVKLSGRLLGFDEVSVATLIQEMERLGQRKFKPRERVHWDEFLTAEINAVTKLKGRIRDSMDNLNALVYRLYGLDEDDIRRIEGSVAVS